MTVTYYTNFSKRINSTKIPTGGTNVTMTLKYPTSIERPAFNVTTIPTTCTYLKWDNRYYYVTGIQYDTATQITITCELDVLATFKSNILATKAFVEYAQSVYNADILDPRISNTATVTQASNSASIGFLKPAGSYMLTCVSNGGVAVTYILTPQAMDALGYYISTTITDSVADTFIKRFGSVYNCILGCVWVPFDYSGSSTTVKLGNVDTQIPCESLWPLYNFASDITISIPWIHNGADDIARRSNETIELFLPGYGVTNIDPAAIGFSSSLTITPYYDRTGGLTYKVVNASGKFKAIFSCNVGVPIAVTQFTQSVRGMLLGNMGTNAPGIPERATQGTAGMINSWIADIGGRLSNVGSVASSKGGNGGGSAVADMQYDPYIRIYKTSYN